MPRPLNYKLACGFEETTDVVGVVNVLKAGHARFACTVSGSHAVSIHRSDSGIAQWLQHVFQLLREVGRIDIPGQPTLLDLQDADAPRPRILLREAWLMHRAGLAESSPNR